MVKDHLGKIDRLINILNPDFFSEDPKMFLGDHDSYFKIVKKRSILFYYLSRIILYSTLIYILFKFLTGKVKQKVDINRIPFSKQKFKFMVVF